MALVVAIAAGADRLLGWISPAPPAPMLFPPGMERVHESDEFRFEIRTNRLGFRDRDFGPREPGVMRVLAIGDSFTYGWGVDLEDSWVKQLERRISATGRPVEIANLGVPGGTPESYALIAERAVPVLQPDLLVVAMLQLDDLSGTEPLPGPGDAPHAESPMLPWLESSPGFGEWILPNATRMLHEARQRALPRAVQVEQSEQLRRKLEAATPEQRAAIEALDPEVKRALFEGGLNPGLVWLAIGDPDYFLVGGQIEGEDALRRIEAVGQKLERVRDAAAEVGAGVLVLSVPYGPTVSPEMYASCQQLGFRLDPAMLHSAAPDEGIRRAAAIAGLPFLEVTERFRAHPRPAELYYRLDGHFSRAGHQHFAKAIAPFVESHLPGS